jgi:MFS transporter, SP family, sugar:H+ symporter
MQSSVMAFFPNIAAAKLDLQSLYKKYVNVFATSSNNSTDDCHITGKMSHLPVLLIDRTFFSTGAAIRIVASSYGALILRWLPNKSSVVQVSF